MTNLLCKKIHACPSLFSNLNYLLFDTPPLWSTIKNLILLSEQYVKFIALPHSPKVTKNCVRVRYSPFTDIKLIRGAELGYT